MRKYLILITSLLASITSSYADTMAPMTSMGFTGFNEPEILFYNRSENQEFPPIAHFDHLKNTIFITDNLFNEPVIGKALAEVVNEDPDYYQNFEHFFVRHTFCQAYLKTNKFLQNEVNQSICSKTISLDEKNMAFCDIAVASSTANYKLLSEYKKIKLNLDQSHKTVDTLVLKVLKNNSTKISNIDDVLTLFKNQTCR